MYPLFESICVIDGKIQHPQWHQWRYEWAYQAFYGERPSTNLLDFEIDIEPFAKGIFKLKISYNETSKKIEFEKYSVRKIKTLKLIEDNNIDYHLKFSDRECLDKLYQIRGNCDDVLIIKNGMVTDSSFCNIVFFDGREWITPGTPLLKGTARERLLRVNKIIEQKITVSDIKRFESFKLINAMRSFESIENHDISNILK